VPWHRRQRVAEGSAPARRRVADARGPGLPARRAAAQQLADAFVALKTMGWKEREARQAVDRVQPHVGADEPLEAALRKCLAVLPIPTRPAVSAPR